MRSLRLAVCLLLVAIAAFAQGSLGTITGTVSDATGAVVVNARVEAKQVETGVIYPTVSTDTGNFSIGQLPIGKYELTVSVTGFKKYERSGLTLAAAQIMRIDVPMQVGSNTEAVTVTAEATLLKTESSELVHNVTGTMLQELPIMAMGGAGSPYGTTSGFRDPFALVKLIPGVQYTANTAITANGNGDKSLRVEGQVSGNLGGLSGFTAQTQPSVDAIQEVAVQTSNYSAELGNAGGAIINMTMKSGTNQYHGSLYDYAVNEVLNAYPSMHNASRNQTRRHDYGGTLGGPINIPKLYKGSNRTFFFWSFEQFRENLIVVPGATAGTTPATVPVAPYLTGNFQDAVIGAGQNGNPLPMLVGANPYMDPLGRTGFVAGQIFDPFSGRPITCNTTNAAGPNFTPGANCTNGVTSIVRDPFAVGAVNNPGALPIGGAAAAYTNQLPPSYISQTALNIQKLFPAPVGPNSLLPNVFGSNYQNPWVSHRTSQIPSLKIDESVGSKGHVSFYWSSTATESQFSFPLGNNEGFPLPITQARGTFIYAKTIRLNYDYTLTPSILLHVGGGYSSLNFGDHSPVVNSGGYNAGAPFTTLAAAQTTGGIGLPGGLQNRTFPLMAWTGTSSTVGGMSSLGPQAGQTNSFEQRPSANANATWVKGNHNFKLGFEGRTEGYPARSFGADGNYTFATTQTGQPALGDTGGSTVTNNSNGFAYASFLMGLTNITTLTAPTDSKNGQNRFGLFLQDTWKITRKLTLDYGVRWDYGTYSKEEYGRANVLGLTAANPNAGNHPGGSIFEATCGCNFVSNYPYQIGPRVGIAYQIDRKTVFRGGAGVVYQGAGFVGGTSGVTLASAPGPNPGDPSTGLSGCPAGLSCGTQGAGVSSLNPVWPNFSAASGFSPGTIGLAPGLIDPSAMRSPRIYQFSVGLQREIHRNLVVEASYVGNRGIWLPAAAFNFFGPSYNSLNITSPALLNQFGFQVPTAASLAANGGAPTAQQITDRGLLLQGLGTEKAATNAQLAAGPYFLNGFQLNGCTANVCPSVPYAGFPTSGNVRSTIIPFPQYGTINPAGSPLGKSWYDSLQVVGTQRLTHGLSLNANYTYSKALSETSSPDPLNPIIGKTYSGSDLPHQFRFSSDYVVPRIHSGNKLLGNKALAYVLGDWGVGWYLQYQSAAALALPGNVTGAFNAVNTAAVAAGSPAGTTFCPSTQGCLNAISDWLGYGPGPAQLIPGMSPWSVNWTDNSGAHRTDPIDINCHCFNPTTTQVLNPAAFQSIPTAAWGANQQTVLRDFRGTRIPQENANISRVFHIKERMSLQIRVEFQNIFNRLQLPNPGTTGFSSTVTKTNGLLTAGYGTYGNIQLNGTGTPRTGTFVARLQF